MMEKRWQQRGNESRYRMLEERLPERGKEPSRNRFFEKSFTTERKGAQ
jgi:hypothetical protein